MTQMFKLLRHIQVLSVLVRRLHLRLIEQMRRALPEMQPAKLSSTREAHIPKTRKLGSNLFVAVLCQSSITSDHWMRSCRPDLCRALWMQPTSRRFQLAGQASRQLWQHIVISCSARAIFLLAQLQALILLPILTGMSGCLGRTTINQPPAIILTMPAHRTALSRR